MDFRIGLAPQGYGLNVIYAKMKPTFAFLATNRDFSPVYGD
jgi:hypothetical protein